MCKLILALYSFPAMYLEKDSTCTSSLRNSGSSCIHNGAHLAPYEYHTFLTFLLVMIADLARHYLHGNEVMVSDRRVYPRNCILKCRVFLDDVPRSYCTGKESTPSYQSCRKRASLHDRAVAGETNSAGAALFLSDGVWKNDTKNFLF